MMGGYRARDLLLAPNLVSLLRLPLAAAFVAAFHHTALALAILALAGLTDVVDGYLARRLGRVTATGAVLDGLLDKLFAAIVIGTLMFHERLSWVQACLLGTRELGELPLVIWWSIRRAQRRARAEDPRANALGKLATVIQFGSVVVILSGTGPVLPWLAATSICGAVAALAYWRRELAVSPAAPSTVTLARPKWKSTN